VARGEKRDGRIRFVREISTQTPARAGSRGALSQGSGLFPSVDASTSTATHTSATVLLRGRVCRQTHADIPRHSRVPSPNPVYLDGPHPCFRMEAPRDITGRACVEVDGEKRRRHVDLEEAEERWVTASD
jgi:hypothetical protein